MRCLFPLTYDPVAKKLDAKSGIQVPCGKCFPCLRARSREWAFRSTHEQFSHVNSSFITLTYSDENLPKDSDTGMPCLVKDDYQRFFKRVRKAGHRFRYLAAGEYGPRTLRPHYHAVLYGLNFTAPALQKFWPYGFVSTRCLATSDLAGGYVASYTLKKSADVVPVAENLRPFIAMSNGIGREFALKHARTIMKRGYMYFHEFKIKIPRYYLKLFEFHYPDLFLDFLKQRDSNYSAAPTREEQYASELADIAFKRFFAEKRKFFDDKY
ncbi:replication initiator protein [robinz microvirus RP_144]|nr:replication initiator protein [robinz microvirus RP_144]